jgi:hypothetical protein
VTLLPEESETIVVAHDGDQVILRISQVISPQVIEPGVPPNVLAGWVKGDRFQLIIRQGRINSFMPVAEGTLARTRNGCVIFLRYRLMPFTRLYLLLWTVIALISGAFLAIYNSNILIGLGTLAIIGVIHAVAWANFRIHMRPLHDIIFKILG